MPGGLHPHAHAEASRLQLSVELLGFSITVVQWSFTALTSLFHKKCNLLKARVVIYAYNHHVRLLSPEPAVVKETTVYSGEAADIVMQSCASLKVVARTGESTTLVLQSPLWRILNVPLSCPKSL